MARVIFRISLNGPAPATRRSLDSIKAVLSMPGFGDFRRIGTAMWEGTLPVGQAGQVIAAMLQTIEARDDGVELDQFFVHIDAGVTLPDDE